MDATFIRISLRGCGASATNGRSTGEGISVDSYITVEAPACGEFVEKRSRFIGEIRPVSSEEEAAAFLAEKRAAHRDAGHNCFAYILRAGGAMRYGDDGEPQGTAGVPILEVLRREGIVDAAIVVTRYFGGTLLGANGLVRAYTRAAKLAVDAAARVEISRCADFSVRVAYPLYDRLALLLSDAGAAVLDTAFAADVTVRARLPAGGLDAFSRRLTELSGGCAAPFDLEECFASTRASG